MTRLEPANLHPCSKCKTPKHPHQVCQVCGTYKGVEVLKVKHRVTRAERRAAEKAAAAKAKAEAAKAGQAGDEKHEHKDTKK